VAMLIQQICSRYALLACSLCGFFDQGSQLFLGEVRGSLSQVFEEPETLVPPRLGPALVHLGEDPGTDGLTPTPFDETPIFSSADHDQAGLALDD